MYARILVPLDGSQLAECVLPHVRALAGGSAKIEITFLYVVPPLDTPMVKAVYKKKIESEAMASAQSYLKRLCLRAAFKDNSSGQVLVGKAADTIVEYAAAHKIDLIVMATHGRSGISHWVYGSVAEKVIHASKAPIWLVKAASCKVSYGRRKLTVVVPLDGSPVAESVLPHLKGLRLQLPGNRLDVVLMRVCEIFSPPITYPPPMSMSWDEYLAHEKARCKEICSNYLSEVSGKLAKNRLAVRTEVPEGNPAEKIIGYVKDNSVDLVIMSTHGRTGISKWAFGSIAEKVLKGAACPILLIHAR
ncbi:MAG: universal stress protein [Dehalococcoidia bacterium]|nr:universal stress protein [Dehalococcoidia bacterium]